MPDTCGTGPEGFWCFAPAGHPGDHDFGGARLMPAKAPVSPAAARRARRRVLVAQVGEAAASAILRGGKRSGAKGRSGELEVRDIWRAHGWTAAGRSPGSGALRPHGVQDVSPWPGDLFGTGHWIVEVKRDERVAAPSRGWVGEAFVRGRARDLERLVARHRESRMGLAVVEGCLWARANRSRWTVWVAEEVLATALGAVYHVPPAGVGLAWVAVPVEFYFDRIAGPPVIGRGRE